MLNCLFVSLTCIFSEGSNLTPAHHYSDFRFKTYAPIAFRYFRELFGIRPDDYLVSTLPWFLSYCPHIYIVKRRCSVPNAFFTSWSEMSHINFEASLFLQSVRNEELHEFSFLQRFKIVGTLTVEPAITVK